MPLRIISGQFRRRLLKTPQTQATRPYTDRVRQIVFDRLSEQVENAQVADVFSGVGTMGIEAISRGAQSCVFIEGDRTVYESLKENVDTLLGDYPTVCWQTNVHRTSFRPKGAEACLPYNLVFFDPPYALCLLLEPGKGLILSLG
jgi:16S rRNA (guanine966-N2)-methyltransferase